jgi:fructosamine-3-kinase
MSRADIYYWKCDRPAAFHGLSPSDADKAQLETLLHEELARCFHTQAFTLKPGPGQGNHLTWVTDIGELPLFIRVEAGPELDGHLALESAVMEAVAKTGVRVPKVHGTDATRSRVPFAWQALERFPVSDLNAEFKAGTMDQPRVAHEIGAAVARWQSIRLAGFGPLNLEHWQSSAELRGYHESYADYFHLRLERHLKFLVERGFMERDLSSSILTEVDRQSSLLAMAEGCLVHKDLALWNVLGAGSRVSAFIDFDDAVCGDAMDDLSLLGCFHGTEFIHSALEGYQSVRPLPREFTRRFWLHLLRNMIVKAVIRVGAGYFDRDNSFFLISSSGSSLREVTKHRLRTAFIGLRGNAPLVL